MRTALNSPVLPLFDFAAAKKEKVVGQSRVMENQSDEWKEKAREVALEVARRNPMFTADDIRMAAQARGIGEPGSPNAWGSLLFHLAKAHFIRKTGSYKPSRIVKSHARMLTEWEAA